MAESKPHSMSADDALRVIDAWLPPMGMTSIPEEPVRPAQANELHRAYRTMVGLVEQLGMARSEVREWKHNYATRNEDAVLLEETANGLLEQYQALERAAAVLVAQPFGQLDQRAFYALREALSNPASSPHDQRVEAFDREFVPGCDTEGL